MNKRELVEAIAAKVDAPKKTVEEVVDGFTETIGETLQKGDKVALTGFGTFERRERSARTGQNPQTGEKIRIKAAKVPAFKAGQGLRDTVAASRTPKKSTAKKAGAKKAAAKKAAAKKASAKKSAAKSSPMMKKTTAKKASLKKLTRKRTKKG